MQHFDMNKIMQKQKLSYNCHVINIEIMSEKDTIVIWGIKHTFLNFWYTQTDQNYYNTYAILIYFVNIILSESKADTSHIATDVI